MLGLITKKNIIAVNKSFGFIAMIKLIFTKQKTFLNFLMTNHLI